MKGSVLIFMFVAAIIWFAAIFCMCSYSEKKENVEQRAEPPKLDKQFLLYLEKLSQDESKRFEYDKIVERFTEIIRMEAKKNPQPLKLFFEEIIPIAVSCGLGLAIQVENYASEALQQEMNLLRDGKNLTEASLLEYKVKYTNLEKQKSDLGDSYSELQKSSKKQEGELENYRRLEQESNAKATEVQKSVLHLIEENDRRQKEIDRLQRVENEKIGLENKVAAFEKNISQLQDEKVKLIALQKELDEKILEHEKKVIIGGSSRETGGISGDDKVDSYLLRPLSDKSDSDLVKFFELGIIDNLNNDIIWNGVRRWPEAQIKSINKESGEIYHANLLQCFFRKITKGKASLVEFDASNNELKFLPSQKEPKYWDIKKLIKYGNVRISIPGKPRMFVPAAQLTDDGMDYIKGWILFDELKLVPTGGGS